MKTWNTLILTMGLSGLLALHYTERQRQQRELDALHESLASLTDSTQRQQRQALVAAAALSGAVVAARPPPAAPQGEGAVPTPAAPEPRDTSVPEPEAARQGPRTADDMERALETAFQHESTDPWWSQGAERTARDRLAKVLPGSSELSNVECRGSLCRVETRHQGREQYNQFFEKAFMDPEAKPWNGAFFSTRVPSTDGRLHIVSYLAREGAELPSFTRGGPQEPAR